MKLISEISLWWLLVFALLAAFSVWFFYVKQKEILAISKLQRYLIYSCRFLSIFLLLVPLLGILYEATSYKTEKPLLIFASDNSSSIKNYKDSLDIQQKLNYFQEEIKQINKEQFDVVNYQFADKNDAFSQLNLKGNKTNIASVFEQIFSSYYKKNIGAIVLLSDGNYNTGANPVYAAQKIPFTPIFTIGIGDTTKKKDQLIKHIQANEIVFLKDKTTLEVSIEANRLKGKSSNLSLYQNGKKIQTKPVSYKNDSEFQQVQFEVDANSVGLNTFTFVLDKLDNEFTLKNNQSTVYIEVIDDRNEILILTSTVHPDVSALKSAIESEENNKVSIIDPLNWDKKLNKIDLIIWYEPGVSYSVQLQQIIDNSKIPCLYFIGEQSNQNIIQKLNIGLRLSSSKTDQVQASINPNFERFETSEELKNLLKTFPPISSRYGKISISSGSEVLIAQRIANIQKEDPILYFTKKAKVKCGVFIGEGLWQWRLSDYLKNKNHDLSNELITKLCNYLVLKENASNLIVNLPKRFLSDENVILDAQFYNDNLELINSPSINFKLFDANKKQRNFTFSKVNKAYQLDLGMLKAGSYTWQASCSYGGKKYAKNGSFIVEELSIEQTETQANHDILKQLSELNGGQFFTIDSYQNLWKIIETKEDITSISYEEKNYNSLLDYVWILILILMLLGLEWFIKRWNGYY